MTATSGADSRALPRTIPHAVDDGAAIRSLLDAILANSAEAIVVVDELGDIRFATHGVADLMGHDPEAMVGTSAFGYVHPDDVEDTADLFAQRLGDDGRDPGKDVRIRHSSGDWIEVAATVSLLPAFGSAAITIRPGLRGTRERSLQRRIAVAEFANQLGTDLMGAAETDAVFARISQSLREVGLLSGAEIVTVLLERQARDGLEVLDGWRAPTVGAESPIEIVHSGPTVERLLTGHIVADDLTLPRHGELAELTAPLHATGLLSTPFATGSTRGAVMLLRTRVGTSWWDSDGEFARRVASLYGRVVHSVRSDAQRPRRSLEGPLVADGRSITRP